MRRFIFMMTSLVALCAATAVVTSCDSNGPSYSNSYYLTADFEYTSENYDSVFGSDSVYFPKYFVAGNIIAFNGRLNAASKFTGGLFLSIGKDPVISSSHVPSPYKVCDANGGYYGSTTYTVFHEESDTALMPKYAVKSYLDPQAGTCRPYMCYLNNTNQIVNAVKYGTGIDGAFKDGDWIKVTVTGYLSGVKTGETTLNLADYKTFRDSVVTNWTKVDLSSLGSVDAVNFTMTSSRESLPKYFCMDEMIFKMDIEY
jgi:hypothetical protein